MGENTLDAFSTWEPNNSRTQRIIWESWKSLQVCSLQPTLEKTNMKKYPIAKSDRKPIPPTSEQKLERRRKYYCKNRSKISQQAKMHRWEKAHLPPKQRTRYDISQNTKLCPQCHTYKNIRQFILNFSKLCIMCRCPNLPPLDNTHLTYPVK